MSSEPNYDGISGRRIAFFPAAPGFETAVLRPVDYAWRLWHAYARRNVDSELNARPARKDGDRPPA